MTLNVTNETSELKTVVLGIAKDKGEPRSINPMIRHHLANNTYPKEKAMQQEIATFEEVLNSNGVTVLRPTNLKGINQIFTRDIGFVIDHYFFEANLKYESRQKELKGIHPILNDIDKKNIIKFPKNAKVEGGDVILHNDYIFVGLSDRTNQIAVDFLQEFFPNKKVLGFPVNVDQENQNKNILHLDCTFQPIGNQQAIIFFDGFKTKPNHLIDVFGSENLITVNEAEKNKMFPNIFSISPTKIVIEKNFNRLKHELLEREFEVFEVDYNQTSKLSGLLRCSTLPLQRKSS